MEARNVREVPRLFAERFNAGDLEGMLDLYESEAVFVPQPGGAPLGGRETLREALAGFLATGAKLTLGVPRVIEAGELALVIHDAHLSGGTAPDDGAIDLTTRSADVVRRQADGTWLIVIDNPWGTAGVPPKGEDERDDR